MRQRIFLLLIGALCGFGVGHANPAFVNLNSDGESYIEVKSGGRKAQVKIQMHEVQIGKPSDSRPSIINSNCTYSRYPCSVVDSLEIRVDGAMLFVPRSVFADLADLTKASLRRGEKMFILQINGGDASEAYTIEVQFDATQVRRRTLFSGTSTRSVLQEISYKPMY